MKGGAFLIQKQALDQVFIPEMFNEEQMMFKDMVSDFLKTKVWPIIPEIDKDKSHALVLKLLEESGDLGLLGAGIPEQYGGGGVDFNTEALMTTELGAAASFGVAAAAHSGIGTLPILYFGNEAQRLKYLPGLCSGKLKASYCLTEPDSGSDALAAKTKAELTPDGNHYIINGQKMWITNGGFADLLIVFAQVEGNKFTGFIVETNTPGVSHGDEEIKLGIKGSSTCQIFFENVKIPKENLLGEVGKGHKIAFNVLNIGRFKLCAMVVGGEKKVCNIATKYALERKQFGKSISEYGAIQHKLAEMAIKTFACESATFRTSGLINDKIAEFINEGMDKVNAKLKAAEEYSIECAILKVMGSESVDYIVDEAVQIFGGAGYSEAYPVARLYRDARINRIFEGTNEINRMLIVGMLLKKALKGEIDLMTPALAIQKELMSIPDFGSEQEDEYLFEEKKSISNAKKAILMIAGAAVQKFMLEFEKEQEIMMYLADMAIELYTIESTLLRLEKLKTTQKSIEIYEQMLKVLINDGLENIHQSGKNAICGFAEGDELRMMLLGLKRFCKYQPINTIAIRKQIAQKMIMDEGYMF